VALKLLLDSHVKKAVVDALRRRAPRLDAIHLADWRRGAFLHTDDAEILAACYEEGCVWLTYDQQTVPDLLRQWAAEDRPHAGVVFGDRNTVLPNDVKAIAVAFAKLLAEIGEADTTNLVRHLRRADT
jgi:hypothetical protein